MNIRSNPSSELGSIRQRLAWVLLQHAWTSTAGQSGFSRQARTTGRPGFSQSEMAAALDTSREMVDKSLTFLQSEGAIRIERHRMFINQEALERIVAVRHDGRGIT